MRALALLLLCVVLLAVLQASYIVAEAKKHNGMRITDDSDREYKHDNKKQNKKHKGDKPTDVEKLDEHFPDDMKSVSNDMANDQPAAAAAADPMMVDSPQRRTPGRRERVSKEERRARKEQRKAERKEQRGGRGGGEGEGEQGVEKQQKKDKRQQKKAERKEEKQGKKMERQRAKEEKKAQRKAARRENKDSQRVTCTDDSQCGEGECCIPNRSGEMSCRQNKKPKAAGKKCLTSCSCDGELQCYAESGGKSRRRQMGKCTNAADADLTNGAFLTAKSLSDAAAAAAAAQPAA